MIFITAGMGGGSEWAAFDFWGGAVAWADSPFEPGKSFGGVVQEGDTILVTAGTGGAVRC
jgi:hypothetical protein